MENALRSHYPEQSENPWGPDFPNQDTRIRERIEQMGGSQAYFLAQRDRMRLDPADPRRIALAQIDRIRRETRAQLACIG